jgi:DNA-binding NarL/FixJ family response regulator
VRLILAEDSGLLRNMLAEMLTDRGFAVVGQAETKPAVLHLVRAHLPDVVVLDIRLPPNQSDEGLQAADEIRRQYPEVGLLVLSHYAETAYAVRLLESAGSRAVGYLVKDRVPDVDFLVSSITRVAAGDVVIDPEVVARIMHRRRETDPLVSLTPRERLVLSYMAEGDSNAAIARRLRCGSKTVERHATYIARKLGLPEAGGQGRSDVNLRVLAVLTYLRAAASAR